MATGSRFAVSCFLLSLSCIGFLLLTLPAACEKDTQNEAALFVFGDSLLDVGNNIHLPGGALSSQAPYGQTTFKTPNGRFSDGRLIVDFIAELAGLPEIPPYLKPHLSVDDFIHGVNFASAWSGVTVETMPPTIKLTRQVKNFLNVSSQLRKKLNSTEHRKLMENSVFLFHTAARDYFQFFQSNPSNTDNIVDSPEFIDFSSSVIDNISAIVEDIYEQGGRKFAFMTLMQMGCTPYSLFIAGEAVSEKNCSTSTLSAIAKNHNKGLLDVLQNHTRHLPGFRISVLNFSTAFARRYDNPTSYDLKNVTNACCGSGKYNGNITCGLTQDTKKLYEACPDPSNYLWFNGGTPTEHANQQLALIFWNSSDPDHIIQNNLQNLFAMSSSKE